jgi:hypothetical protein
MRPEMGILGTNYKHLKLKDKSAIELFSSILFYLALNSNVILNRQMRFLYYLKNIQTNASRRLRNQRNRSFIVCRNPSWLQQRLLPSLPSHHS